MQTTRVGYEWRRDLRRHAPRCGSITASTFTDNERDDGGAIFSERAHDAGHDRVHVFSRNDTVSANGGAIYDEASTALTITGSKFSDNSAANGTVNGGAIYINTTAGFTVTASSFDGNQGADGAAIYDTPASAETITGSTFTDNGANDGALYVDNTATTATTLTGDEFDQNRAAGNGGAIYWSTAR